MYANTHLDGETFLFYATIRYSSHSSFYLVEHNIVSESRYRNWKFDINKFLSII